MEGVISKPHAGIFRSWMVVLYFLSGLSSAFSGVTISAPQRITAFSCDVTITVSGAANGDVVELFFDEELFPLTGQIITQFHTQMSDDVKLVFNCGYFSRLGDYKFSFKPSSDQNASAAVLAISTATEWPGIDISMKRFHQAYTTDVKITIATPPDICSSDVANQHDFKVRIVRDDSVVIKTYDVAFPPTSIFCECDIFFLPGNYVTQLQANGFSGDDVISTSDIMRVDWSGEYELKAQHNIFQCKERRVKVSIQRPPCSPRDDVVEAVAMLSDGTSHVIENVTIGNSDKVAFLCSKLLKLDPSVVCFRYVTSGAVVRTICRSNNKDKGLIVDGNWSIWSYWNTCNRRCSSPIRQRTRSCDNPAPIGKGEHCVSNPQTSIQFEVSKQSVEESNHLCPNDFVSMSNMTSQDCLCGCAVSAIEKGVLVSPISGECNEKKTLVWTFYTSPKHVIHLSFIDLQQKFGDILSLTDQDVTTMISSKITKMTSSSNVVTLRYVRSSIHEVVDSCGFTLGYESIESSNLPTTAPESRFQNSTRYSAENDSWTDDIVENPVLAVGLSICIVIVLLVVSLALVRCRRQRIKDCKFVQNHPGSLENRLIAPPDGKSSSNIDAAESDRPSPVGENSRHDDAPMTPKPRAAYYLAQRQLQLMKREGKDNSSQVYASTCMNDHAIHEQEDLLFGPSRNQSDANT